MPQSSSACTAIPSRIVGTRRSPNWVAAVTPSRVVSWMSAHPPATITTAGRPMARLRKYPPPVLKIEVDRPEQDDRRRDRGKAERGGRGEPLEVGGGDRKTDRKPGVAQDRGAREALTDDVEEELARQIPHREREEQSAPPDRRRAERPQGPLEAHVRERQICRHQEAGNQHRHRLEAAHDRCDAQRGRSNRGRRRCRRS